MSRNILSLTVAELMTTATRNEQLKYILDAIDAHLPFDNQVDIDPASWDELTVLVAKHKRRIDSKVGTT